MRFVAIAAITSFRPPVAFVNLVEHHIAGRLSYSRHSCVCDKLNKLCDSTDFHTSFSYRHKQVLSHHWAFPASIYSYIVNRRWHTYACISISTHVSPVAGDDWRKLAFLNSGKPTMSMPEQLVQMPFRALRSALIHASISACVARLEVVLLCMRARYLRKQITV